MQAQLYLQVSLRFLYSPFGGAMMKIKLWIITLAVFALTVSVCASTVPAAKTTDGGETTPWYYDQPTVAENAYMGDDGIVVGPYTFRYIRIWHHGSLIRVGLTLYSCQDGIEEAVIPSEVGGVPVVGIGGKPIEYDSNEDWHPAFSNITSLKKVVLPESVVYIGESAFSGCVNLTDLTLPSNLKVICTNAFYNCPGLTELQVTSDLEMERYALTNAIGLKTITVKKGATVPSLFGCTSLTDVYLEEGVGTVCGFTGCTSLKEIHLPSTTTTIGYKESLLKDDVEFVAGTKVTFLDIPDGVYYFADQLFANSSLESIVVPTSVGSFGEDIFENTPIERIYFRGTREECPQELIDQAAADGATIYYYAETRPSGSGNYWRYVNEKPQAWLWTWG